MVAAVAQPAATAPQPAASELSASRQHLTLAAVCMGQAMILLDNTIVNVALPSIQRELGVTPSNLEWVVNAYVLALASLILVGGTLGDRYGRKRLFLAGLAIFAFFSAACALAPDDPQLVAFRACQGVGAAVMAPLTLAILVDAFPPERRATAIGIWAAVAGIGFGAGPVLGGVLIELFDWSAIFWVNVPIAVAGFALTLSAVRESRGPRERRLDLVGAALVAAGLFGLTFALIETNEHGWTSGEVLALMGVAVVLLIAFVAWERRAADPMVPLDLFRRRPFRAANGAYALAYAALASMFYFVTLFFQNVKGWSALETGLSWIPLNLPFLAISPFAGRLGRRVGPRAISAAGALLGAAGILGLAELDVTSSYMAAWPCYVLVGLGFGLLVPAVSAAAMAFVPGDRSGTGSGILNSSRQVGAAVGLAVLGSISVAVAGDAWRDTAAARSAGARAQGDAVVQLVAGAEGRAVGRVAGPDAAGEAFGAFVSGLHTSLRVAGVGLLVGAATAFWGLRADRAPDRRDG
jgi:DHA2 family methylenomycin A resistance protein-like MFS transporter